MKVWTKRKSDGKDLKKLEKLGLWRMKRTENERKNLFAVAASLEW